jgi:peptide/nickel transport system substrate-binding protein
MLTIKRTHTTIGLGKICGWSAVVLLVGTLGCERSGAGTIQPKPTTLRIGFGLAAGTSPDIGIQQTARNIALEQLVRMERDGRAVPVLAESWSVSRDGLAWHLRLRSPAWFHSGKPANAEAVRQILQKQLPSTLGPAFEDIQEIRTLNDRDLEIALHQPSAFLLEGLDAPIQEPGSALSGTGPFYVTGEKGPQIEMRANESYYKGKPLVDRIALKPYTSVRSAWADMLRGQIDMLYDVGVDALDSLGSSREVRVFTFQRGYAYLLLLNVRRPHLDDPGFRRALNKAIDREALVRDIFEGHGSPAAGPVWPHHWAYSEDLPKFEYQPQALATSSSPRRLKCLFVDASHERLALVLQRQLQAIGVQLEWEVVAADKIYARLQAGDFDAFLADFIQGPALARPYLFWHTGAAFNFGHYSNTRVDAALDAIRHASDDLAYKAGVSAFQRAIVDDPPAIFLVWRERARAVSARFQVPANPDDVLGSLHLWRPATDDLAAQRN